MRNSNRTGMTYRKLSDSAKRAVITSRIRKGDTHRIANEMGYSVSHVTNVIAGRYQNSMILNRAYDMTRGRVKNSLK